MVACARPAWREQEKGIRMLETKLLTLMSEELLSHDRA
jgi:hypothetical protein